MFFFLFLSHSYTSRMVTLTTLLTGFYLSKVKGSLPSEKIIVVLACQTVLYLYLGEKKKKNLGCTFDYVLCKGKCGNGAMEEDWGWCSEKTMYVNVRPKKSETDCFWVLKGKGELIHFVSFSEFESALEEVRDVLGWPPSRSDKHSAGGCSQRSDTFLLNC